ncbi:immunoglobulin superfamily member 6 [Seriola dumerili]|uniref:immunoglobulin superfamily member 6 n=1 Tax=Seriola dumerili TaxID=41447 RepID=UPI000BBEA84F|nr:immunoglobulin superfamily member 6 [Seriola dumerili]
MRSFTSCQATDMDWLFWFSLLLTHLLVTESMGIAEGCLTQPVKEIWRKVGQDAVVPCNVSLHCSATGLHYEWFVFKETSHPRLNLRNPVKYSLDGAFLHIRSLNANDSGIYHCAAVWPGQPANGTQHVGVGTTLIVKGEIKTMARHILLLLSFVLLVIYSMAVVALIILKCGCNMSFRKRMCKTGKINHGSKKTQFRDVLREMNNRRNQETDKQTAVRNHSQVEASSPEVNSSTDDIYQNV